MVSPLFSAPVKQNKGPERAGLGLSFCSVTTRHEICDLTDGSKSGLLPKQRSQPITLHLLVPALTRVCAG